MKALLLLFTEEILPNKFLETHQRTLKVLPYLPTSEVNFTDASSELMNQTV